MKAKKIFIWVAAGLILFLIFNACYDYLGIKLNTGYINGEVTKVQKEGKSQFFYTYYKYEVNGISYNGKCGGNYSLRKYYLVVYNVKKPKYSMLADYPFPVVDSIGNFIKIDTSKVEFDMDNYSGNNISDF